MIATDSPKLRATTTERLAVGSDIWGSEPGTSRNVSLTSINWIDDSPVGFTVEGLSIQDQHTYLQSGAYQVVVASADRVGHSAKHYGTVIVEPAYGSVAANGIQTVAGYALSNILLGEVSADGKEPLADFAVTVEWGDGGGVPEDAILVGSREGYWVIGSHTYASAGHYLLRLMLKQDGHIVTSVETEVAVFEYPTNVPLSVNLGAFRDANPNSDPDELSATYTSGDPPETQSGEIGTVGGNSDYTFYTVSGEFEMPENGTQAVHGTVDNDEAWDSIEWDSAFDFPRPFGSQRLGIGKPMGSRVSNGFERRYEVGERVH